MCSKYFHNHNIDFYMFRIPSFKIEVKFEAESWIEKITVTLQTFSVFRVKSKVGAMWLFRLSVFFVLNLKLVQLSKIDLWIYLFTFLLNYYLFIYLSVHPFIYFFISFTYVRNIENSSNSTGIINPSGSS